MRNMKICLFNVKFFRSTNISFRNANFGRLFNGISTQQDILVWMITFPGCMADYIFNPCFEITKSSSSLHRLHPTSAPTSTTAKKRGGRGVDRKPQSSQQNLRGTCATISRSDCRPHGHSMLSFKSTSTYRGDGSGSGGDRAARSFGNERLIEALLDENLGGLHGTFPVRELNSFNLFRLE